MTDQSVTVNHSGLVAISGGIGSGKSVVSRCLRAMGYQVYDCDSEARSLMDNSDAIKSRIVAAFGEECVRNGCIDRRRLSQVVFGDSGKLSTLNSIVHGAVRTHLVEWSGSRPGLKFVETAILYQSGIDALVDAVIEVVAPLSVRIERVVARNGLTVPEVKARIDAQDCYVAECPHQNVIELTNDGVSPLLPRLENILGKL